MGYLVKSNFPAFSKAVFSFWFRIPGEVFAIMDLIGAPPDYPESNSELALYRPSLFRIIPCMTFGQPQIDIDGRSVQPSFIGIDYNFGSEFARLACNLQTPVEGGFTSEQPFATPARTPGDFYMSSDDSPASMLVTTNAWHHSLISFDISGPASISFTGPIDVPGGGDIIYHSSSTFTWAYDDVAKGRNTLGPSGNLNGLGDTEIISNCQIFGPTYPGRTIPDNSPPDTSTFAGGFIPAGDFRLPSGGDLSDKTRQVQMAKLQVFTGVTLDTSLQASRRAFITADRRPAAPSLGAALLGRAPAIHFDTSKDWIDGRNRGTAGNFTKTGTINTFPGP